MDRMVINNLLAQPTNECALLQQELLKSFVETRKQRGITESLMKRLAVKKMNAIEDMYGNVHVTNDKFGECGSDFYIDATADRITLTLKYYVNRIPLDGLSNHDKKLLNFIINMCTVTIQPIMFHLVLRHFALGVVLQVVAIGVTLLMILSKVIFLLKALVLIMQ